MTGNRNRWVIIIIALMFFAPLLAALIMQSKWVNFETENTVNRGELVQPPVPLEISPDNDMEGSIISGRWLLVFPLKNPCDAQCEKEITALRQVHISTGRFQDEVAVVLLSETSLNANEKAPLDVIYPEFVHAVLSRDDAWSTLAAGDGSGTVVPGSTYIVDPEGNLILRYKAGYSASDLNRDLRKLLKWSGR